MPQSNGQGNPGPRVVGVQVHQVFEDMDSPGEVPQLVQDDAEVQEQVGGVGRSGSGQFQQLDTLPDLAALAEGYGGIHRLETRRDPADLKGLRRGAGTAPEKAVGTTDEHGWGSGGVKPMPRIRGIRGIRGRGC